MVKLKQPSWFVPVSVPCYDWEEESGEHVKKTVIIAPIRFIESEDEGISISWACSRGLSCRDQDCRYSHRTNHNKAPEEQDNTEQAYEEALG